MNTHKHLLQIVKLTGGLPEDVQQKVEAFFDQLSSSIDMPMLSKTLLIEHFVSGFEYYLDIGYEIDKIIDLLDISKIGDFYRQGNRQYFSLDNAAIVYPMGMRYGQMPMFRLSIELKEDVEPSLLQLALDFTIKRFPLLAAIIKNGFFWHYLETTNNIHLVEKERDIPCKPISIIGRSRNSFRVLYYKKRISVEFFHALTDGSGGLSFIKTLVAEYLRLKGNKIANEKGVLDINGEIDEREFINEFSRAEGDFDLSTFTDKKSLQLDGKLTRLNINKIIHYVMDTDELRNVSRRYDATITAYLTAIMFLAAKRCISAKQGLFNIQIPINMRKFNNSITLRNYSMYFNATMDIAKIEDKEALIKKMSRQIKEKGTEEEMIHMMMTTRKVISTLSFVPLFVKIPIMQMAYGYLANSIIGSTFSNLGKIELPEEMAEQIDKMYFLIAPGRPNRSTSTLVSVNNKSVFSIIMNDQDLTYLEEIYSLLKEDGLNIMTEGSAEYES